MVSKLRYFLDYFRYLRNPIQCLLFKFGFKKDVIVKIKKNSREVKVSDIKSINSLMILVRDWNLNEVEAKKEFFTKCWSNDEIITIKFGINIFNPLFYQLNHIFNEYYYDYYSDFGIDYKGRTVIDIGANAGDSALYFASQGAEVYAFEPVKECFDMAVKNIDLNENLKENIKMFNNGVSYKKGRLNISAMGSVSDYIDENDSYDVEVVSMDDILEYADADLLKMDCEGCEFAIIENCDLSMFNEILFEYHSEIVGKDHNILVDKLKEQGFNIEFSQVFGKDLEDLGFIHAYK